MDFASEYVVMEDDEAAVAEEEEEAEDYLESEIMKFPSSPSASAGRGPLDFEAEVMDFSSSSPPSSSAGVATPSYKRKKGRNYDRSSNLNSVQLKLKTLKDKPDLILEKITVINVLTQNVELFYLESTNLFRHPLDKYGNANFVVLRIL